MQYGKLEARHIPTFYELVKETTTQKDLTFESFATLFLYNTDDTRYFICEHEKRVIGFLGYEPQDDHPRFYDRQNALCSGVGTAAEFQRQGIAKKLLLLAQEEIQEQGFLCLDAFVQIKNIASQRLFQSIGATFVLKNGRNQIFTTYNEPCFLLRKEF